MDLKSERVERWAENAQRRPTSGFLTSEQFHLPNARSLTPPRFMNSTADAMPCCRTQSLWFALLFLFQFFFLLRNERHFREILNSFLLEFHCGERYLVAGNTAVSFAPLEPDWTDGSHWAKQTLWEEHTHKKGERQFPGRCTTEL